MHTLGCDSVLAVCLRVAVNLMKVCRIVANDSNDHLPSVTAWRAVWLSEMADLFGGETNERCAGSSFGQASVTVPKLRQCLEHASRFTHCIRGMVWCYLCQRVNATNDADEISYDYVADLSFLPAALRDLPAPPPKHEATPQCPVEACQPRGDVEFALFLSQCGVASVASCLATKTVREVANAGFGMPLTMETHADIAVEQYLAVSTCGKSFL